MQRTRLALLPLLLLPWFTVFGAPPKPVAVEDLEAPVERGAKITYLDLARNIFKGLREDAKTGEWRTGSEKVLRRIGEKERTVIPEASPLGAVQALAVRGDGRHYLLLTIDMEGDYGENIGGGAFAVAVFPEGSTEPTDVADLKGDRFCVLDSGGAPSLGPDDAFLVANSHHNSNQGYITTSLFHVRGGRLRLVESVFTLSLNGMCAKSFREELAWSSEAEPGNPYPRVIATVTLSKGPGESEASDCPHRKSPPPEVFRESLVWDKAKSRFVPRGGGLKALARFNRKNV